MGRSSGWLYRVEQMNQLNGALHCGHENLSNTPQGTYPLPETNKSFLTSPDTVAKHLFPLDFSLIRKTTKAKREQWAALNLRQHWADEEWMRGHLRVAGILVTVSVEPATEPRIKAKLRQVGVFGKEIKEATGMTVNKYLKSNPNLPLWAALALILESTGRFTPADERMV